MYWLYRLKNLYVLNIISLGLMFSEMLQLFNYYVDLMYNV